MSVIFFGTHLAGVHRFSYYVFLSNKLKTLRHTSAAKGVHRSFTYTGTGLTQIRLRKIYYPSLSSEALQTPATRQFKKKAILRGLWKSVLSRTAISWWPFWRYPCPTQWVISTSAFFQSRDHISDKYAILQASPRRRYGSWNRSYPAKRRWRMSFCFTRFNDSWEHRRHVQRQELQIYSRCNKPKIILYMAGLQRT